MGFIKAGFTGGFIGIVIGVAAIFVKSPFLQKLSYLGFLLAEAFGKVCIDTITDSCSLAEKFTTVLATIVGNCIAYFIVGVLISLGFSVIKMWFSKEETAPQQSQQEQQTQQQKPAQPQTSQQPTQQETPKPVQEQVQTLQQRPSTPAQKIKLSKQKAQKKSRKAL